MNIYNFTILVLLCHLFSCTSQKIACELSVQQEKINSFDLLHYTLVVKNLSTDTVEIQSPSTSIYKPVLEHKSLSDTAAWLELHRSKYTSEVHHASVIDFTPHPGLTYSQVKIPPKDSIVESYVWLPFMDQDKFLAYSNRSGFLLRSKVDLGKELGSMYTNELEVAFASYENKTDQLAADWLKTLDKPAFFYELLEYRYSLWGRYSLRNIHSIEYCKHIITTFPDSQFSKWAKFQLAMFYYSGYTDSISKKKQKPELDKALSLLIEIQDFDHPDVRRAIEMVITQIDPVYFFRD